MCASQLYNCRLNMRILAILSICFVATLALPLRERSLDMIEGRATGNVRFYLYTLQNPNTSQELFIDDVASVQNSYFEKSRHTKIIIHGWGGSHTTSPNGVVRQSYFTQQDYNIISVDWYPYAKLNYLSARAKVPVVGEDVAKFIDFLHDKFGLNFNMLVVIGHSLGAHVAGFCGKSVKRGQVAGIVGLDPAYPLYIYDNPDTRLANTDGKYVQTIQTNGNLNGFLKPIGMASFYPNWGRLQPGCGLDITGSCSHGRSVTLYAESLRGYSYTPIHKCVNYESIQNKSGCDEFTTDATIGDPLQIRRTEGIFYFETEDKSPYGHIGDRNGGVRRV